MTEDFHCSRRKRNGPNHLSLEQVVVKRHSWIFILQVVTLDRDRRVEREHRSPVELRGLGSLWGFWYVCLSAGVGSARDGEAPWGQEARILGL